MTPIGRPHTWKRTDKLIVLSLPILGALFVLLLISDSPKTRPAVAPMFVHGLGAGIAGSPTVGGRCAPIFEEEALGIIRRELAAAGVNVTNNEKRLPGVVIVTYRERGGLFDIEGSVSKKPTENTVMLENEFMPDLADVQNNIFVEYVEIGEYPWLEDRPNPGFLNHFTAPRSAAERLRLKTVKEGNGAFTFGVFYDPLATFGESREEDPGAEQGGEGRSYAEAEAESNPLLRLQVSDFIDWLVSRGVIDATGSRSPDDSVTRPRDDG